MVEQDLKKRTKIFAIKIIKFVEYVNQHGSIVAKIIANRQLLRSGTGIASNYRAACRSKSRKDFISKIGTVVEEADETQFWLEIIMESGLVNRELVRELFKEVSELTAIMTTSRNSAIKNQKSS
jgi:four helix bundle protein